MGVQGLWKWLEAQGAAGTVKPADIPARLDGAAVAIDASTWILQAWTSSLGTRARAAGACAVRPQPFGTARCPVYMLMLPPPRVLKHSQRVLFECLMPS